MGQRILGLDIGAASVKAVVVETAHRAWTVAASGRAAVPAQASVPPGAEPPPTLRERQRQAVRELLG